MTFLNFIAAPEVLQRHHGDVLEGQVHRSVGHGVANRNQPQTRSGKKNRENLLTPISLTLWLKCVLEPSHSWLSLLMRCIAKTKP